MAINLIQSRIGLLFPPIAPIWTGTVVSYSTAGNTFRLTVTTTGGSLANVSPGLAIDARGELVRIRAVGVDYFDLAVNGAGSGPGEAFEAGASVAVADARYPFTRYQRITGLVVTETGDDYNQLTDWQISGATTGTTFDWQLTRVGSLVKLFLTDGWGNRVARGNLPSDVYSGQMQLTTVNDSGISGYVTVTLYTGDDSGQIEIGDLGIYKDNDIGWGDLGIDDAARSRAAQGPVGVVEPAAAWRPGVGDSIPFSGAESYATYNGWNGGARAPATIASHAWDPGPGGVVAGSGADVSIAWSTPGFRHLKHTVTDSNGVSQSRFIPAWIGISPFTSITSLSLSFSINAGWRAEIEMAEPPDVLPFSPVAIVDMDTHEVLFYGYIWPSSVNYGPDKTDTRITILSDLAFAANLNAYGFDLTGTKGDPIGWWAFDMNSLLRGMVFFLRWHTNLLELGNWRLPASVGKISDEWLEYQRVFNKAKAQSQLEGIALSSFLALYGRLTGGADVRLHPLYQESISTPTDDAATLALTGEGMARIVNYDTPTPTASQIRMSGYSHGPVPDLDFYPVIFRSPANLPAWGAEVEVTERLFSESLGHTGDEWAAIFAGRHFAVLNTSHKYDLEAFSFLDLAAHRMIDIPAPLSGDHPAARVVVEEVRLTHNRRGFWQQQLVGRTFGTTAEAFPEPPQPLPPAPNPPPIVPPIVPPEPTITENGLVGTFQAGVYSWSGSMDPSTPQPIWTPVNGGLDSLQIRVMLVDPNDRAGRQFCLTNPAGARTIYRREPGVSLEWTPLLTTAAARALCGETSGELLWICADAATPGKFHALFSGVTFMAGMHVLTSINNGDAWTKVTIIPKAGNNISGVAHGLFAHGGYIWFGIILDGFYIYRATNNGSSWLRTAVVGIGTGQNAVNASALQPNEGYYGTGSGAIDLYRASGTTVLNRTVLQDVLALYMPRPDTMWFSGLSYGTQRFLQLTGGIHKLYTTTNGWSTTDAGVVITPDPEALAPLVTTENENLMVFVTERNSLSTLNPHAVTAADLLVGGTATGRSGPNPATAPFTDSIPYTCGGVCYNGIQAVE